MKEVGIYTDGACSAPPGPGGYGAVLLFGSSKQEISKGFRLTTNNRMEVLAAIEALNLLKDRCSVALYSDSKYLVNSMSLGWALQWQANSWKKKSGGFAKNQDLWKRMLDLEKRHDITFNWVKGHADNPYNNRCDELATTATREDANAIDEEYEQDQNRKDDQGSLF